MANSWASASLSTISSLAKHEAEISKLMLGSANEYSATNLDIRVNGNITGSSLDISDNQGNIEIVFEVSSELTIAEDEILSISMYHSDDNDAFTSYGTGQRIFYEKPSGGSSNYAADTILCRWVAPSDCDDYIKPYISTSNLNTGKLNIYTSGLWQDKIDVAKQIIGDRLELILYDRNIRVNEDDGEQLLDTIANPSIFGLASDYLTLHLIYVDLSKMQAESYYTAKANMYYNKYEDKFSADIRRINLDYDDDGTVDERRVDWQPVFTH